MKGMIMGLLIGICLVMGIMSQGIGIYITPEYFMVAAGGEGEGIEIMGKEAIALGCIDGSCYVGDSALEYKEGNDGREVLNLMHNYAGRTLDDEEVKRFIKENFVQYDFEKHPQTDSIGFKVRYNDHSDTFTIEEIWAILFNYIKERAEVYYQKTITNAIVTIPSFYTYKEREALRQSIELSNLALNTFISENLAAAIEYQSDKTFNEYNSTVLLVNIGQWYSQASIYQFNALSHGINGIRVITEVWDKNIGSKIIERRLALLLLEKYNKIIVQNGKREILPTNIHYRKFQAHALQCLELINKQQEIQLTIDDIAENGNVVIMINKNEYETLTASFTEDIMKLIKKTLINANDINIHHIEYYGDNYYIPLIQKDIAKISQSEFQVNKRQAQSFVYGAALLTKPYYKVQLTNAANSELNIKISNTYLNSSTPITFCENSEINENTTHNSSCIHHISKSIPLIPLRKGFEIQRLIKQYHDSNIEIVLTERMEGETEEHIIKTYKIHNIEKVLLEMQSNKVTTLPMILLKFYFNRAGQISMKAEYNYNVTIYMGKLKGSDGSEEIAYSIDYAEPLSKEEIAEIDKEIEQASSEDEKSMLEFKKQIGMQRQELVHDNLLISTDYINPKPMITRQFNEAKERLKRFYASNPIKKDQKIYHKKEDL